MHPDLAVAVVSDCSCSERRRAANRANALKSTGPRTAEGKAAVAGNAVTHGLRAERVVTDKKPSRRRAFEEFAGALRRELKPVGVMQSIVFDRIAILAWKLRTLPAVERRMLRDDRAARRKLYQERYERVGDAAEPIAPGELSEAALVARWFHNGRGDAGNCYATLRRYEAGIERSFYRACAELKRLREEDAELAEPLAESEPAEADPMEAERACAEHAEAEPATSDSAERSAEHDEGDSAEQSQVLGPDGKGQETQDDAVANEPVGRPLLADIDAQRRSSTPDDEDSRLRRESAKSGRPTAECVGQGISFCMPIKTKRWDDPREPDDGFRLLVTRYRPRGVRKEDETWDEWRPRLGPSKELHAAVYHATASPIAWPAYRSRYLQEQRANQADINELARRVAAGETITLLCSSACERESRCHRSILKELIEKAVPADEMAREASQSPEQG